MMLNLVKPIVGASLFIPHGHCYLWKPDLVGLHILSDGLIALAYYSIPLALFYFVRRRRDLPFTWVFLLFSAFIIACGTTHLMEIWTLWHPTYWLSGILKLITAAISLTTAVALLSIVPKALAMPSPAQMEAANQALQGEIADRKQFEQSLAKYASEVEDLYNNSPCGYHSLDVDGFIIQVNDTELSWLGYTRNEVLGRSWSEFITEANQRTFQQTYATFKQQGWIRNLEFDVCCKDGRILPVLLSAMAVKDAAGNYLYSRSTLYDVRDRKAAELALQQSEAKNQAMLAAIPDLLLRVRRDGTCLDFIPPNASEAGAFLPIRQNLSEVLPPDLFQFQLQRIEQALATGELQVWEHQLLKNGKLSDEEIRLIPCGTDEVLIVVRDISDRKQAEESLRHYERIVSASTDAILLLDRNHVYQVVNQAYLNWYDKRQDEVVGHPVSDLLPLDVYETIIKPRLDQCLAGQVVQYEMWSNYPTLGSQFLSITYDPYFDPNQTVSGVVVSLRNITTLKQAELELELQSIIVRNMAEGVCMVKVSDGIFVYANPKFERMFGYDPGELIGQHAAIVNYEDRNTYTTVLYEALARAILEQGEATYEVQNAKKDGTSFWCQATTSVFEHPNYGDVFVAVQQDITGRKQVEDQLRDLSNRLKLALKSGAIGTWDWDVTANKLTWDDRMYELYGVTPDQFTNVYEAWANSLYPDDRPPTEAAIQQALAGEKDYEPEFRVRHPDGSVHCLKAYAMVERNQAGEPHRMIGINYDITQLKQTEETTTQASLREKEVLLKEIHHRVKNNLGVVDGLLQMQSRRSQNPEVVAILKESQNRIASIALVHEKLYSSKDLAKIDFSQYIADLTAHLFDSYNVHANQITLTTHIDPISLDIDTAVPCGLIINELVSNALKYAFSNRQTGEIQVTLQKHQDQILTLTVQDNGVGFPEDFNLKQTETLGMSLVQGLVKQIRGTLEIHRNPGTTAVISFARYNQ